jgi:hypothetical protein
VVHDALILRRWSVVATRWLDGSRLRRWIEAAVDGAGARGQNGFAEGCRSGTEGAETAAGQTLVRSNRDHPCARGGRTVEVLGASGELRGAVVVRCRPERVGRLADKGARLGARGARGALTARPRVPRSTRPERANCRQRACLRDALVQWGLSWRSPHV